MELLNETYCTEKCKICVFMAINENTLTYLCVLYIIGSVLATIENTFTLIFFCQRQQTKKMSSKIMASLALSDLLVGLVAFPLHIYQLVNGFNAEMCHIDEARRFTMIVLIGSSAYTICLISYDRYIMMKNWTRYHEVMTTTKVKVLISLTWLIPIIVSMLEFVNIQVYHFFLVLCTALPYCLLPIFYYKIVNIVKKSQQELNTLSSQSNQVTQTQTKVTRRVKVLIVVYLIFMTPGIAWFFLSLLKLVFKLNIERFYIDSGLIQSVIALYNSCANPVIYVWMDPKFQAFLRNVFKKSNSREKTAFRTPIQMKT